MADSVWVIIATTESGDDYTWVSKHKLTDPELRDLFDRDLEDEAEYVSTWTQDLHTIL